MLPPSMERMNSTAYFGGSRCLSCIIRHSTRFGCLDDGIRTFGMRVVHSDLFFVLPALGPRQRKTCFRSEKSSPILVCRRIAPDQSVRTAKCEHEDLGLCTRRTSLGSQADGTPVDWFELCSRV